MTFNAFSSIFSAAELIRKVHAKLATDSPRADVRHSLRHRQSRRELRFEPLEHGAFFDGAASSNLSLSSPRPIAERPVFLSLVQ